MLQPIDMERLRIAYGLIKTGSAENRLIRLRKLILSNGGIWTVPDEPHDIPVLYEATLFGVTANADTPDMLPVNWMRATANILDRYPEGAAA